MTQTEAQLAILKAAEILAAQIPGCVVIVPEFGAQKLATAIRKVAPKTQRAAARLKDSRTRRQSRPWVPAFLDRAINAQS
jgi:hypothetical protein